MKTHILEKLDIYKGTLILVNKTHRICEAVDSSNFVGITLNKDILLEQKTAANFMRLINDLKCENQVIPISGYRSYEEQEKIYIGSLFSNGRKFTEQYVALPDCSEHQTGLAIDVAKKSDKINFICPDFPDSGIYLEFKKKAADYGFIQRYTKEKENITGISCEPWHFRYVGMPHAKIINQNNFCLEEYINFIKAYKYQKKHLKVKIGINEAEIFYLDIKNKCIDIDDYDFPDISGNNEDGFIATILRSSR